ncbi:MAG: amidohydrolase family protein [Clostridiales bacterium]|jgi:imidazolonepropionase-like amidohydrolase|nr:amidohydrolase family protein [Clostridiales bacterium]
MLITNVHVLPIGEQREIKSGYILVDGERIVSVGSMENAPKWQEILDGEGAFALPGFVDAHNHLGLFGVREQDANERNQPVSPHFRVIDSISVTDEYWDEALAAGVTTAVVAPGSGSVISGQIAAFSTRDKSVLRSPVGIKCSLGENPKNENLPQTRMAAVALLRETLAKAVKHAAKRTATFDFVMEALKPVVNKKLPLHIHAHALGDVRAALRIAEEFNIEIILIHATGSAEMAAELAELNIPVVCGPQMLHRSKAELAGHSPALAAILTASGVVTAIATDHPETLIGHLPLSAALAVKEGMPPLDALEAITINAAKIAGIDDLVGSLAADKLADILLFDKFPLELYATPKCVISHGKKVELCTASQ